MFAEKRTIAGIEIKINVFFRPYTLVMYPNKKVPSSALIGGSDATQDAISIVMRPDGNGESSDVSKFTLGLAHPAVIPKPMGSILTVCVCACLRSIQQ